MVSKFTAGLRLGVAEVMGVAMGVTIVDEASSAAPLRAAGVRRRRSVGAPNLLPPSPLPGVMGALLNCLAAPLRWVLAPIPLPAEVPPVASASTRDQTASASAMATRVITTRTTIATFSACSQGIKKYARTNPFQLMK
jgi:hypothetical protein